MRERIEKALLLLACLVLAMHVSKLMGCVVEARAGFLPTSIVAGDKS